MNNNFVESIKRKAETDLQVDYKLESRKQKIYKIMKEKTFPPYDTTKMAIPQFNFKIANPKIHSTRIIIIIIIINK